MDALLLQTLKSLLDWETHTGGWDAECWRDARAIYRAAMGQGPVRALACGCVLDGSRICESHAPKS